MRIARNALLCTLLFVCCHSPALAEPKTPGPTPDPAPMTAPTLHQFGTACLFARGDQVWGYADALASLGFADESTYAGLWFAPPENPEEPPALDLLSKNMRDFVTDIGREWGLPYYDRRGASFASYYYVRGPVAYGDEPLLRNGEGECETWVATFLIDGSGKFHQGWTLLYPQRLVGQKELERLINSIDESFVGRRRPAESNPAFQGADIALGMLFAHGEEYEATISYRTAEIEPGRYQFCLMFW